MVFKRENGGVPKPEYWTQIKIKESGLVSFLSVDDIRWIEAYDNYIKVWVSDRFHLVRMPLKEIETKLDSEHFKRIHRSTIVALEEVVAIRQGNGQYEVLLKDQTTLKLSRSFKKSIEDSIKV
nr:LytTR family DNA-binding domain-containing protein [Roseivirga sp. E12]